MADYKVQIVLAAKDVTGRVFGNLQSKVSSLTSKLFSFQTATAAVAAAGSLAYITKQALETADAIGKAADVIGIHTGTLQEYQHAARLAGVDAGVLTKAFQAFAKRVGEAKQDTGPLVTYLKKFDEQLLSNIQSARSTDDALRLVFERMGGMASATDRAALASAAFSRSGIAMVNMVKNGAEGLETMRKEARDLGLVIDDDIIRNSEAANDAIEKLTRIIKVQFTSALASAAPAITTASTLLIESITDIRQSESDLENDKSLENWGDKAVYILAFVADAANSAKAVIGGSFQTIGKTLGAGAAQFVELIQGDFEAVKYIGQEWRKDIDKIFDDVIVSSDKFRQKLAEINARQGQEEIFPKLKGPDIEPLKQFDWDKWAKASKPAPATWQELFKPIEVDIEPFRDNFELIEVEWEKFSQNVIDLTQHTAEAMQDNFSNLFFDAMQGEFKSLEDYVNAVMASINRVVADYLAKMLTEQLFGNLAGGGGGGGGGGGWLSSLFSWLTSLFHSGGIVGETSTPGRFVSPALFAGARRLHDGLMPDEVPAILKRGEWVIDPKKQQFSTAPARSIVNNFNVSIQAPQGSIPRESMSQLEYNLGRAVQRSLERNR